MSVFFCHRCDNLRDSDDGCKEGPRFSLICSDCMDEEDDDEPAADMSFDSIYRGLLAMGCPEDIAHELAREKSR